MDDLFANHADTNHTYAGRYPMRVDSSGKGHVISVPDGELIYAPAFFSVATSDRLFSLLAANRQGLSADADLSYIDPASIDWCHINWRHETLSMYGKKVAQPRFTAWYGDHDKPYTYSGLKLAPNPWVPMLNWLRDRLHHLTGIRFNSVLLNWYRDGNDHISWHTDAEPELGTNPVIASINVGATRRFLLRRRDDHQTKLELPLGHGSLLIMQDALQHHWQHAIPKQKRVTQSRFNLTFRVIHPEKAT